MIRTLGRFELKTGDNVAEPLNRRVEIKITPISQADVQAAQGN